jgi:hypothetical protein
MTMALPLNLTILKVVQDFGKIPREFLYDKVAASNTEIDEQVSKLVERRALKVDGDQIMIAE